MRPIDADALKQMIDFRMWDVDDDYPHDEASNRISEDHAVKKIIDEMPTIDAEPHWILCSERLPEENCETGKGVQYSDFVLMSVEHKEDEETIVDYGHTVDGKWYSDYTDCFVPQEWKVTAWMPLPKPYRGEE